MRKTYKKTSTIRFYPLFEQEAKYWIDYFGLKQWEVIFTNLEDRENRATIGWKVVGRIAKINLATDWEEGTEIVTPETVKKAAFHEICELLLSRLGMMAEGRICNNKDNTTEETHAIIRTIENTIFKARK